MPMLLFMLLMNAVMEKECNVSAANSVIPPWTKVLSHYPSFPMMKTFLSLGSAVVVVVSGTRVILQVGKESKAKSKSFGKDIGFFSL